ncbi:hypothetical protein EYF80_009809 [Liparis tanakae]|uniref:Uncharacterized protein n=1 Tax=Liparis tanakae TaxID=230148 RepID=A0A4Z2IQ78_9TELE|nr:hypothetical protein EYF80_009809 [Liparis tanakae]
MCLVHRDRSLVVSARNSYPGPGCALDDLCQRPLWWDDHSGRITFNAALRSRITATVWDH